MRWQSVKKSKIWLRFDSRFCLLFEMWFLFRRMFLLDVFVEKRWLNETLVTVRAFVWFFLVRNVREVMNFPRVCTLHVDFFATDFADQNDFDVWVLKAFYVFDSSCVSGGRDPSSWWRIQSSVYVFLLKRINSPWME